MNIKIPRMNVLTLNNCCKNCKYYMEKKYQKNGGKIVPGCSIHDIAVYPEQVCNNYVNGLSQASKVLRTTVDKLNLEFHMRKFFTKNRLVIGIDFNDMLNMKSLNSNEKSAIKKCINKFYTSFYYFSVYSKDLSHINRCVLSDRIFDYCDIEEAESLFNDDNLFRKAYDSSYLLSAIYSYLYEKYK